MRSAHPEPRLRLSLDESSTRAKAVFELADVPIGHAYIAIDGSEAELEDFVLLARGAHPNGLLNFLGFRWNYRGRGHGSALMPMLVSSLRDLGIRRLGGIIQPARGTLPDWYRRMGFQVDERTGRIVMELSSSGN